MMRESSLCIRDYHLRNGKPIKQRPSSILSIIVGNIGQNHSFSKVETDVKSPVLPNQNSAFELERNTFGLSDLDRFQTLSRDEIGLILLELGVKVVLRRHRGWDTFSRGFVGMGSSRGRSFRSIEMRVVDG